MGGGESKPRSAPLVMVASNNSPAQLRKLSTHAQLVADAHSAAAPLEQRMRQTAAGEAIDPRPPKHANPRALRRQLAPIKTITSTHMQDQKPLSPPIVTPRTGESLAQLQGRQRSQQGTIMFPPDGSHTPDTFAGASPLRRLSTQGTVMTERQSVGLSFSPRTGPAAPHNPKSPKSPRPTDSIASMRSLGRKRSTQATLPFPNERETMVLDGGMPSTPSSVPARPSLMPWMPKQVAPESSGPIVEVQAEGYDGFADGPMTLFDCLATVFGLVERLYKDFDQDGTGDIPFSQMLFQFKFKGLKDPGEMKRLFERHIDERHHNATIRFLEFLQLIYLWRDLVGPYDVVLSDRVLVQAMGAGMQELIKACKTYGITADSRIKMSELQFMIGDMLPDADPAAQIVARLGLAEPFTFVQILGVVYVAVRGTAFLSSGLRTKSLRNALPDDHTGTVGHIATGQECQDFMFYVREGLKIMEEDFDSLSANSKFVSLEDLLRECTHQLRTRTRPVERGCDNCGRLGCEFVCPHPGCRFDVCGHCWQEGLQAHIVPPGGLGPKRKREAVRELIRDAFTKLDLEDVGYLHYFEYIALAFVVCRFTHYADVAHDCKAPAVAKMALMSISRQLIQHDSNKKGGLDWEELTRFLVLTFNNVPPATRVHFQKLAPHGALRLKGFVQLLYLLMHPNGKYATVPMIKPRVQVQDIVVRGAEHPTPVTWRIAVFDIRFLQKHVKLEEGTQWTTWKATYEGQLCIAKIPVVTLSDREKQLLLRSAAIHARVHHPCVETVLTVSTEPGSEVVLTEYIPGGNLQVLYRKYTAPILTRSNPFPRKLQWRLARELADALLACHEKGVMHRDICCSNISLTEERHVKLMLSDYCTDEPKSTARCGTMGFMAPEMLRDNGVPYDSACDVFSYGCTLYEITHNAVPFVEYDPKQPDNQEFQHFRSLVLSGQRPQIDPHRVTEGMKQLILWCWGDAPYSRPNMIQCVKRLEMLRTEYQIW